MLTDKLASVTIALEWLFPFVLIENTCLSLSTNAQCVHLQDKAVTLFSPALYIPFILVLSGLCEALKW